MIRSLVFSLVISEVMHIDWVVLSHLICVGTQYLDTVSPLNPRLDNVLHPSSSRRYGCVLDLIFSGSTMQGYCICFKLLAAGIGNG
ncbi:hypothetical protein C5167_015054 [Papaver somniferum]|uniref:Secreted protein n=1 Tax=Papaver somniferum TaxID=3469 RepID=A0A4Y7J8E3_PAPSO|nr:hypothetical protein C5167_015054 [Papaver somniferum]